jgi:hypothetical protein
VYADRHFGVETRHFGVCRQALRCMQTGTSV